MILRYRSLFVRNKDSLIDGGLKLLFIANAHNRVFISTEITVTDLCPRKVMYTKREAAT
jgi:hypothetical protein